MEPLSAIRKQMDETAARVARAIAASRVALALTARILSEGR